MNAEVPATGIMKNSDYGNFKTFTVSCVCQSPDHNHQLVVEADEIGINVTIFTNATTDYWSESIKQNYEIENEWVSKVDGVWKTLWNGLLRRIKLTKDIWATGYAKHEACIILTTQQALNYAEVLKQSIQEIENFQKNATAKSSIDNFQN